MKLLKGLLLILLIMTLSGCATTPVIRKDSISSEEFGTKSAKDIQIEEPRPLLPVGEHLTYEARWLGMSVGTVTAVIKDIEKIDGRKAYIIELVVKTNDFCSKIYPIEDRYISHMDKERLITLRHEVSRREGRYKKDAVTTFDHKTHTAHFKNFLDNSEKSFSIPENAQDTLSAVYYFRTLPVKEGDKINYEVVSNEEIYSLFGLVKQKKFIKLPDFPLFEAFLIEPYAKLGKEQVKKGTVSGYFSADETRLPLFATIKGPLFTQVTITLKKVERAAGEQSISPTCPSTLLGMVHEGW